MLKIKYKFPKYLKFLNNSIIIEIIKLLRKFLLPAHLISLYDSVILILLSSVFGLVAIIQLIRKNTFFQDSENSLLIPKYLFKEYVEFGFFFTFFLIIYSIFEPYIAEQFGDSFDSFLNYINLVNNNFNLCNVVLWFKEFELPYPDFNNFQIEDPKFSIQEIEKKFSVIVKFNQQMLALETLETLDTLNTVEEEKTIKVENPVISLIFFILMSVLIAKNL